MPDLNLCPRCGGPLPNDGALGGGCPRCMLELGFDNSNGGMERFEPGISSEPPAVLGRYRILRLIGEGGMGAVYEAEQDHPRRTVALKIIKSGMASADLLRRFEQESQALGRLQHPGIAQIYEAGTVDTGFGPQPYFAMEFIRGRSPREYAEANQLGARDRLQMMVKICDAVHHAHQRGLIHRDLKPGNILIDQTGQPKILDFGVARVTDSDSRATQQTDMGQLIGTLAYMSPEQALADPLDIDTRSDVYSLGVILYELLSGRLPYTVSKKVHEAIQAIREEDPARLSTSNRTFRGDIETIVSKALEKDRERRYASAAEMAADIQRYLNDEPIVARPASRTYQIRKFAKRQKALVIGVAAVFVVLVAGIVVATTLFVYYRKAEQEALIDRDRTNNSKLAESKALVRETEQRHIAESARSDAEEQALIAQRARSASEANLYSNDIYGADREWKVSNIENSDRLLTEAPVALRNWEWNYLSRRNHMEDAVIAGHQAAILAMGVSPDGKRLRTVSEDNTVKDWDLETRKEVSTATFGGVVAGVVLSADGRVLHSRIAPSISRLPLTGSQQFLDLFTGKKMPFLPTQASNGPVPLSPNGERVVQASVAGPVALSPTGERVVQAIADDTTSARRYFLRWWDTGTGDELASLGEYSGRISHLTFDSDGSRLAFVEGASVRILNLRTRQSVVVFGNSSSTCTALAFSRDGTILAVGFLDESVRTWRTLDGMELWTSSIGNVKAIAFSPDSRYVATALEDQTIGLMDGSTGREVGRLKGHSGAINALSFTSSGSQLVSVGADKLVHIWNLRSTIPALILNPGRIENYVRVSSDGTMLLTATETGLKSWDTKTGVHGFQRDFVASRIAVDFGDNSARYVLVNRVSINNDAGPLQRDQVLVIDARTGRELSVLHLTEKELNGNQLSSDFWISSDGRRVAFVFHVRLPGEIQLIHSQVEIWETGTGNRIAGFLVENLISGHDTVRFSPSGNLLAIGTFVPFGSELKGGVDIYDTTTGQRVHKLDGADVGLLVFSPEGKRLAVVEPGKVITIWDAETGMKIVSSRKAGKTGTGIVNLAFSPDGTRLVSVSSNGEVWLWDANSGREIILLSGSSGPYLEREVAVVTEKGGPLSFQTAIAKERSISFSPDGRQITLTSVAPDPKGATVRIETWDGSPLKK